MKTPPLHNSAIKLSEDVFLDMMFHGRYGSIKRCPRCWEKPSFSRVGRRKCYSCAYCGHQLHPLADTIFHKSSTPLSKWMFAFWLVTTDPTITSEKLQEYLGTTYKTAWRIRKTVKSTLDGYRRYDRQQVDEEME